MFSLYIHIPFCVSKCHYCDFYSLGMGKREIPEAAYVDAVCREVHRWSGVWREPGQSEINTVFFGGGTPSLLAPPSVARILSETVRLGRPIAGAEVTLEINPKTASPKKLKGFIQAGVNRASMGVQSLDDGILKELGRAHTGAEALRSLEWLYGAGFSQVSIDLMYGLPKQDLKSLQGTLEELEVFPLRHLSAYELIVEEHTPFYDRHRCGALPLPQTEAVLAMRERIESFIAEKSMSRYEISNYAVPGAESRHNRRYWSYESYVGLGAGAVSFLRKQDLAPGWAKQCGWEDAENTYGWRLTNRKDLNGYMADADRWAGTAVEPIPLETAMVEFIMMGLRKSEGILYADFEKKFGRVFPEKFTAVALTSSRRGLLELDPQGCRLSEEGVMLSNEVLQEFFE